VGGTRLRIALAGAALAALVALPAAAGGEMQPEAIEGPRLAWSLSPAKLPKDRRAPSRLRLEFRNQEPEGRHPPALREIVLDFDRDVAFDLKGYPTCRPLPGIERPLSEVCGSAGVGEGFARALVAFPESRDVEVTSKVFVFNERRKHGVTKLFAYMYFSNPVPGGIVATIKLKKLASGPYGTEMSMSFPKIASGAGSITSLVLHLGKGFGFGGTKRSVVSARCPDGHLDLGARLLLEGGTEAADTLPSRCTGSMLPPSP
jgi:hypothetical protein